MIKIEGWNVNGRGWRKHFWFAVFDMLIEINRLTSDEPMVIERCTFYNFSLTKEDRKHEFGRYMYDAVEWKDKLDKMI